MDPTNSVQQFVWMRGAHMVPNRVHHIRTKVTVNTFVNSDIMAEQVLEDRRSVQILIAKRTLNRFAVYGKMPFIRIQNEK